MPPASYRGRPVTIEAIQLDHKNRAEVVAWVGAADVVEKAWDPVNVYLRNEHGVVVAEIGDWIIKGSRGEYYPCKDFTFKEKYEPAPTPQAPNAQRR